MKAGDLIKYWFARAYPVTGILLKKYELDGVLAQSRYLYTIEVMENSGCVSSFDVYVGDRVEVISEAQ